MESAAYFYLCTATKAGDDWNPPRGSSTRHTLCPATMLRSLLVVTSLLLPSLSSADAPPAEDAAAPPADKPALSKLKISALKAILASRGTSCDGCAEKADYVEKAWETRDLPTVSVTPTPPPPPPPASDFSGFGGGGAGGADNFDIDALMAQMNKGKKRIERLKKKMEARGMDTSGIDASSLGSLADGGGIDDEQLIQILASIGGAGKGGWDTP